MIDLQKNKEEFLTLLRSVNRPGIENLVNWLENQSDFFIAPSSTKYHNNCPGGLCEHTLNVYHAALKIKEHILPLSEKFKDGRNAFTDEELLISCLLHDLCKVNYYKIQDKVFKDESAPYGQQWKHYDAYVIEDMLPIPHSAKSAMLAQCFIKLTANEMLAIIHHMNCFSPATQLDPYEKPAFSKAAEEFPIVMLVAQADCFASFMMERTYDKINVR